ncbi:MAG: hypothetical protein AB7H79_02275, partial [Sphingomonas sp.]
MRLFLAAATAALLASCGTSTTTANNSSGDNAAIDASAPAALPDNAMPAQDGNGTMPGDNADNATAGGPSAASAGGRSRDEMLADCSSEARAMLPGVDAAALCGCAVDRVIGGAR